MEEYILEECPICRGAGLLMHEGGWKQESRYLMWQMVF